MLLVTALGGPERKVTEVHNSDFMTLRPTWSPDGKSLVVSDKGESQEPFALFLVSIDTGERLRLTSPPASVRGDDCPAFSPDGRTLAFSRFVDFGLSDLYLLSVSGAPKSTPEAQRVPLENINAFYPTWTEDGRAIIFSSSRGQTGLWKLVVSGSSGSPAKPEQLASLGQSARQPTISRLGAHLAYVHLTLHNSIWRIAALDRQSAKTPNAALAIERAGAFINSTQNQSSPQFSPYGKRIAFMSNRSGRYELWICDGSGQNAVQLTSFDGPAVTNPTWSPDGQRIAFDSDATGNFDVFVVSAGGGKPQPMTSDPANDGNPSWSKDGRWIYFDSARSGQQEV